MAAFFNLAILDSTILVFPLILTHTCQEWFPPFAQKKLTHISLPTICTKKLHSFNLINLIMAAILNSAMLDSAILHKTLTQTNFFWLKLIHSVLNLMMAAILNSANLNSTILDSAILVFPLKLTHTCQDWFPPFAQKYFTHSFWLNLMMAAILKSDMLNSDTAILDSDTLLSSLRFTQKHSHSTLILNQTNSIWLKLIPSHITWWWQPSWILPSCIQLFCTKKTSLIHSLSTWGWQPSWILPWWIQPFCTKLWLKLIWFDSNSFILYSTWWWQPSWNLTCWIQTLPSWIQTLCYLLSDSLKNTLTPLWFWTKLIHSDSNSLLLT